MVFLAYVERRGRSHLRTLELIKAYSTVASVCLMNNEGGSSIAP